jgi:predicted phage-related endonuclease
VIEIHEMEQGSDEWFAFRKGKLTASQFGKILSSKSYKLARIIKTPSSDELAEMEKRAKKQLEVYNQLMDGELETRLLNASGLKGLIDKKLVSVYEDYKGCSLLKSASESHIENILGEAHYPGDDLPAFAPNAAMERGTKLEPVARTDFEFTTGHKVREVGFITNQDISPYIGCSPDGLVGENSGVEFKCPLPQTHLSYHRMGGLPSQYKAQVHGCMAMSGAESWWFYSFCPGFKEFALLVERDAYTENLLECLKQFDGIYRDKKNEIQKLITE